MQLLLFLGSGVSKPSGLPTAADLTARLLTSRLKISHTQSRAAPCQVNAPDVSSRIPKFLRLLKQYDETDIKRVGYTRAGEHGDRYMSTTAIFRSGSTYEDIFFLCAQIKDWGRGWSDHCMTTPLMEAIVTRGGNLFLGRSRKARLNDAAKLAAAACDFIQLKIADILSASSPTGLQLIVDLALMPAIDELNIVTLNHDTLVEQFLAANGIQFVDGFGDRDGDVRWYADDVYATSTAKVKLFKLHGSIDWYQFSVPGLVASRTAILLGSNPKLVADARGNQLSFLGPGPSFLSGQDKAIAYQRGIYADIHHRFHELLRRCHVMVMSGYGWGDHGINCRLETWLDDPYRNKLVLLHPTPEDLTWRSLIVVTSFEAWVRAHRLVHVRQWLCDLRGDDLREDLIGPRLT